MTRFQLVPPCQWNWLIFFKMSRDQSNITEKACHADSATHNSGNQALYCKWQLSGERIGVSMSRLIAYYSFSHLRVRFSLLQGCVASVPPPIEGHDSWEMPDREGCRDKQGRHIRHTDESNRLQPEISPLCYLWLQRKHLVGQNLSLSRLT